MPGSKERQRRRARERYERQRAARAARRRKILQRTGLGVALLLVIGLVAGLVTAFSGGSSQPAAAPAAGTAARCTYTKSTAGTVKPVSLPPSAPDREAAYTATITTNLGPVTISLANSKAPCTVNSFVHLASARFWNDTQCHRVSDSGGLYMLQCGDPTAAESQQLSCTSLPAKYPPFGTITSGLDILQNVANAGTSCGYSVGGGVPKEKIYIKSVAIRRT